MNQRQNEWPALAEFGFVSGRGATEKDIEAGNAVFLLKSGEQLIGKPLNIEIPQYAIHTESETGQQTQVVVIQAESGLGEELIGAVELETHTAMAGFLNEFTLLGKQPPK